MIIENFKKHLNSVYKTIDFCIDNNYLLPALTLIYTLIDAMSWIYRPENKNDSTREDFIKWVNEFLLKDSILECNAIDLYAARCGVVHSMTPRAKLIRYKKARTICYCWGNKSVEELNQVISLHEKKGRSEKGLYVAVHINDLFEYLKIGINRFNEYVLVDKKNFNLFMKRINQYFMQINF